MKYLIHKILNIITKNNIYCNYPITKASTIIFNNINDYFNNKKNYGLDGTKISELLEKIISLLEGGKYTLLYPSGLSCIYNIYLTFLKEYDGILLPYNIYYPNKRCVLWMKKKYNINVYFYNYSWEYKKIYKKIKYKNIKIIFAEIPTSITFKFPNIKYLIKLSYLKRSILIADNSYYSSVYYRPLTQGFDISFIALTKYYSGCNDLLMGAIIVKNKQLYKRLLLTRKYTGIGISNEDCYYILRSISTIYIRYKIHYNKTIKLIKWLVYTLKNKRTVIKKILFPGLNKDKNWRKFFYKKTSSLFSIILKKNINFNIINRSNLFKLGLSWGGNISLVSLYKNFIYNNKKVNIIRFYIGIENRKIIKRELKKILFI